MKRTAFLLLLVWARAEGQTFLGEYSGIERSGKSLTIHAGTSAVRLTFYRSDVMRADYLPSETSVSDSSFAVIRDTSEAVPLTVRDQDSTLVLRSADLRVVCRKSPLRFSFSRADGRPLLRDADSGGFGFDGASRFVRFRIGRDEHFYGGGEQGTSLDKRRQAFDLYNTQVGGYSTPLPTMNISVPLLASTNGYALFFDNPYRSRFDVGARDSAILSYTTSGGELTLYLFAAPSLEKVLESYTWLTGRQPLPPRWAFGFIQSKNRYRSDEEARAVVRTMREKNFPCDAIVLDLAWFKQMGDLRWDSTCWHDPGKLVGDFLGLGIKTILITEPYIVRPSENFTEAERAKLLATDSTGKPYVLSKWWSCASCDAFLLDLTNPASQKWWWDKYPPFMGKSVAGLWTDLGEPERHPDDMHHYLGSTARVHNLYNFLWAETIFAGMAQFRPGERVFNLTRSGYSGIQRFGVIPWSGDVGRTFGGLAVQLPMMLGMGMSALAYHNSDIGGYSRVPTTSELYIRWMQFGTFSPIARAHGAGETTRGSATEPWMFGPQAEEICRSSISLRYRLLPYIYTMAHQNYESGMPLARPLIMMYPEESRFACESSSYLWGEEILVSPVVEAGQREKQVNLPPGVWVNYWTDEQLEGGRSVTVSAPLDRMPLFVKAGSIIPMCQAMRFTDERPMDTLTLCIWPKAGLRSTYTLYEDDGRTLEYQNGRFASTTFTESSRERTRYTDLEIDIGPSRGDFSGKLTHRTFVAEVHLIAAPPEAVTLNGRRLRQPSARRGGGAGFSYDRARQRISVQFSSGTDSACRLVLKNALLSAGRPASPTK